MCKKKLSLMTLILITSQSSYAWLELEDQDFLEQNRLEITPVQTPEPKPIQKPINLPKEFEEDKIKPIKTLDQIRTALKEAQKIQEKNPTKMEPIKPKIEESKPAVNIDLSNLYKETYEPFEYEKTPAKPKGRFDWIFKICGCR